MATTVIAHTEVGSGGAYSISFTSIPQTYSDLSLVFSSQCSNLTTSAIGFSLRFNLNSATNYSDYGVRDVAGAQSIYQATANTVINTAQHVGYSTGTNYDFGSCFIYIPNYTDGTNNKQVLIDDAGGKLLNNADNYTSLRGGLWRGTSAITDIVLSVHAAPNTYLMARYTTATLYGITKA